MVWINGRQYRKITNSEIYHDTWDDAHKYLEAGAKGIVLFLEQKLAKAKADLAGIKALAREG